MERLYELLQQDLFRARIPGRTPVLKNVFRKDIFARARAAMLDETKREASEAYETGLAVKS